MPEAVGIICIGGAAVDRKYRAFNPVRSGTSNPVRGERSFGGVARNVAENLARLGCPVALLSCIGADESGRSLSSHLHSAGVDPAGLIVVDEARTAEYSAVLEPDGSLAIAFADMEVLDHLTPERLQSLRPSLERADWLFADCNLPPASLAFIVEMACGSRCRLAVDAVSVAKSKRLPADLSGVDLLFLNLDEAGALLGAEFTEPKAAAGRLLERGAARIVLTLGADGCLGADADNIRQMPAELTDIVDVTGAGDAMVAGVLSTLSVGGSFQDAIAAGTKAAAATIASKESVIPLKEQLYP
jgi:pseudouridine kinase